MENFANAILQTPPQPLTSDNMTSALESLGARFTDYLSDLWQQPCLLKAISQIPGGASRETYRLTVERGDEIQQLIARRDPPSSLIDTERAWEYRTYEAVYNHGCVPVPEPIVLEENPGALERPFSIMRAVTAGQATPAGLEESEMTPHLAQLGHTKWHHLGQLARIQPAELGVDAFMPTPEHAAKRELDYWRAVIDTDSLHPHPVAQAALRWLERHMPPPSLTLCLVHGDYRTGNYLYTDEGKITAVLDWEMAHIGDPLEDLAWSLDPLWSNDPNIAGRLLPREEAIAIWEQSSGMRVDREAFRWWQIFASVKALAIWISSVEDYANGSTKEPILAIAGWPMMDRQTRILIDRLADDGQSSYAEPLV